MKIRSILLLSIFSSILGVQLRAQNPALDIQQIASVLDFPASELTIENTLAEELKLNTTPVFSSYRVTSRIPFSFYPVQITVAKEGAFLGSEAQKIIATLDALPDLPMEKGGRGPFGSISIDGASGGSYLGPIKIDLKNASLTGFNKKLSAIAELRIPDKQRDVRIAIIQTFNPEQLVKVPGGEKYFESLHSPGEDKGDGQPSLKAPFDNKRILTALGRIVVDSPLVSQSLAAASATNEIDRLESGTGSAQNTSIPTTAQHPSNPFVWWPWLLGAAILSVFGWLVARWLR